MDPVKTLRMKIAQINNTSGIGSIIAEDQNRQGHVSEVFVFNRTIHRQFGGNKLNRTGHHLTDGNFFERLENMMFGTITILMAD